MSGRKDFQNATTADKIKGAANIGNAVKKFAADTSIPVALHLGHGKNMESIKAAIGGGYTSVMIDGSSLPLDDNIALTREVVKYAHPSASPSKGNSACLPEWRIMCSPPPAPTPTRWTPSGSSKPRKWTPWPSATAPSTAPTREERPCAQGNRHRHQGMHAT